MTKIKNLFKYPLTVMFTAFICFIFFANIFTEDKAFSSQENRDLAQMPELSISSLISGDFSMDYETYLNDQFFGRNTWIDIKAFSENVLGKMENNDILYGADGYSFIKRLTIADEQTGKNVGYIKKLLENNANAKAVLIPSASTVLGDKLFAGSPVVDEKLLSEIYFADFAEDKLIELFEPLEQHKDEYIYYRTDHHWTTLGAYYAYVAICEELGLAPMQLDDYESFTVEDFYGSHYRKSHRQDTVPDTMTVYNIPIESIEIPGKTPTGLYNMPQFERDDKYSALLYDNNAITIIKTAPAEGKKGSLLLLKDSYGNSIAPFFLANYETVVLMDMRQYNQGLSSWLAANSYDDILAIYNYDSIQDERALFKLGM